MSELTAALEYFRAAQADQFTATADIHRPNGEPTFDDMTGVVTQAVTTIDEDVPCKVSSTDRSGDDVTAGETEMQLVDRDIKFPVGTDVAEGDLITVVTSVHNTSDIDKQYRVTDIDRREWQIARRCVVEEVNVPMLHEAS